MDRPLKETHLNPLGKIVEKDSCDSLEIKNCCSEETWPDRSEEIPVKHITHKFSIGR